MASTEQEADAEPEGKEGRRREKRPRKTSRHLDFHVSFSTTRMPRGTPLDVGQTLNNKNKNHLLRKLIFVI